MSQLIPTGNYTQEDMLELLTIARKNIFQTKLELDHQLSNPQEASYGGSKDERTLETYYAYAQATQDYTDALELLISNFKYL
ncbi:hypothetical protein D1157_20215 [Anaerotruncus sp. X29]|nr:hypothetical protein [Anaerotruncus sp. X29]